MAKDNMYRAQAQSQSQSMRTTGQINWPYYPGQPNVPQWQQTPPIQTWPSRPAEKYANHVEVTRSEHDATLRFYRKRGNGQSLVMEITVPLGVLDGLKET